MPGSPPRNFDVCNVISTKPRGPIDPCARSGLHAGHRIATTSDSTGQPKRVDEDPKRGCRVSTTPRPHFGSANGVGRHTTRLFERFSSMCAASADSPGFRSCQRARLAPCKKRHRFIIICRSNNNMSQQQLDSVEDLPVWEIWKNQSDRAKRIKSGMPYHFGPRSFSPVELHIYLYHNPH